MFCNEWLIRYFRYRLLNCKVTATNQKQLFILTSGILGHDGRKTNAICRPINAANTHLGELHFILYCINIFNVLTSLYEVVWQLRSRERHQIQYHWKEAMKITPAYQPPADQRELHFSMALLAYLNISFQPMSPCSKCCSTNLLWDKHPYRGPPPKIICLRKAKWNKLLSLHSVVAATGSCE